VIGSIPIDLKLLPDGWFVYGIGELVAPILFAGDEHNHIGFWCELQHRKGGKLTRAVGNSLSGAFTAALQKVLERDAS